MSVTLSLVCFGCFVEGQHVNECFFGNIDVFFYWPAWIIGTYIIDLLTLQQELNVCAPLKKKRHCLRF